MSPDPTPAHLGAMDIILNTAEEALVAAGELDRATLLADKVLETMYGEVGPLLDPVQRGRLDTLTAERAALDVTHFDALTADVRDEALLADIQARFRYLHCSINFIVQNALPLSAAALEATRLEDLAHQTERSTYRVSARPWLHTDPWGESGYVPAGAESLSVGGIS